MTKLMLRRFLESISPSLSRHFFEARWLKKVASTYFSDLQKFGTIAEKVDYARSHPFLPSNQKRAEIMKLLERLQDLKPRTLCEIGADKGGTLALFGSVASRDARILSLDIKFREYHANAIPLLAGGNQEIKCLEADSHIHLTKSKILKWLRGQELDFLFIDGDHSYSGVKADFEMYGPLVRPGGMIAFHDIVPDYFTRFGTRTGNDVGEVPRFWKEISKSGFQFEEFVEDENQDGYGIGLLRAR